MTLKNLPFKPGIFTDATARAVGAEQYWKDCDKVRFYDGLPEKIGGWTKVATAQQSGYARGAADWQAIDTSAKYIAFGTSTRLYIWSSAVNYDVTPARTTGTLANPFTTTNTLTTVQVAHTGHGVLAGDYVVFSGAAAVGGITISGEYTVTSVTNANEFVITHSAPATSSAGPGGGATVAYEYLISPGAANSTSGFGWGSGAWGSGTWGTPRTVTDFLSEARTWALDVWGQDLIGNPRRGGIYTWVSSTGTAVRAAAISGAPASALSILVSQEDRHLIALGAHDGVELDPLLIRWCSQEDYTDWTATLSNTAGDKRLDAGNQILCGVKGRGEHLIFTDSFLYSMQFIGAPEVFGFRPLGDNGGLVGPNAVTMRAGVAYWMGEKEFYTYDGTIRVMDCSVNDKVFRDFSSLQAFKVWAGVNRQFNEVWWLYCSADSYEVDRYVIHNTQDNSWYYGTLDRTLIVGDSDVFDAPYAVGTDGWVYEHEYGTDDDGAAMAAHLYSGDVEIDPEGSKMQHVGKYIPDFKRLSGEVDVSFVGRRYPQDSETQTSGPHAVTSTTKFVNPRMRCRQMSIQLTTDAVGDDFRMGQLRVDVIPHGER